MGYTQNNNPFTRKTSSPLNKTYGEAYDEIMAENPYPEDVRGKDFKRHELYETYKGMSKPEYIKEAKRQAGVYKESGGTIKDGVATGGTNWDAPNKPITESKNKSNLESYNPSSEIESVDNTPPAAELTGKQKRAANKAKRIKGRIEKRGDKGKRGPRAGQAGRLAKAEAKAAGLSGAEARQKGKTARKDTKKLIKIDKTTPDSARLDITGKYDKDYKAEWEV